MVRLRDRGGRVQKKDGDKNRDRQIKRRRFERYAQRNKDKDVNGGGGDSGAGDSSAEESFDEDFEEYDGGKALLSTSKVNTITQASTVRSSPVLTIADEMIGVLVPRRARSGAKISNYYYYFFAAVFASFFGLTWIAGSYGCCSFSKKVTRVLELQLWWIWGRAEPPKIFAFASESK